jgi:molybdenum cofactor cytidylyltransferase
MTSNISAIILAAGRSQRMGQPKMLLPWRETTVLGQVAKIFDKVGITDIIIVTGGDRIKVETEVARLAVRFPIHTVYNPSFEKGGMISSIQAGLSALSSDCKAVLIGLGDQPQVEEITLKDILTKHAQKRTGIIVPSYGNRRGHPVLIDAYHWPELLNFDPQSTLRDFINIHQNEICYVEAGASVLQDLDTPQDYQRYQQTR